MAYSFTGSGYGVNGSFLGFRSRPDSIKTGFNVYDASKLGQEYTYYSLS
jgi:hypothetical protein